MLDLLDKEESLKEKKIAFIGQPEYFSFIYDGDWSDFIVRQFDMKFYYDYSDYSKLLKYNPDYSFFFRGEYIPKAVLDSIGGVKIALSSEPFPKVINNKLHYMRDSKQRLKTFLNIKDKPFDYIFHYDKSSLSVIERHGLRVSGEFVLPVAIDVYQCRKSNLEWDGFFIGRSTLHREKILEPLKHEYKFLHIAHGVWGQSLVDFASRAAICLNLHAENEISWEPRVQMLLSMGAFVISEPITPNDWLKPGQHFIEVKGKDEFKEAFRYYINNSNERMDFADNACKYVRSVLDSKQNIKKLILDIEAGKYNKIRHK